MEIHNLILFIEINAFVNSKSPLFYWIGIFWTKITQPSTISHYLSLKASLNHGKICVELVGFKEHDFHKSVNTALLSYRNFNWIS